MKTNNIFYDTPFCSVVKHLFFMITQSQSMLFQALVGKNDGEGIWKDLHDA